jgi:dTDP-3-amino-3,4,6-trideoxy-alpha-D-glucose transaminase
MIPFLDLRAGVTEIWDELEPALRRVHTGGHYILGPEVEAFEQEFASFCGVPHCVGVASGFDAIQLILRALGVGAGDEVIVPAYTAVPTWMAVSAVGAVPVGVDADEATWNVDAARVDGAITDRTKAIVAVHLFGQPAAMKQLSDVASRHRLPLIEDAAQAHGASVDGRRVGGLGVAAAFSFYPTKNLGALGDGGAVTTDDDALAETVRRLRMYGSSARDVSESKGINSRLDEVQAAVLRVRLRQLDRWNDRRRELAARYVAALGGGLPMPRPPHGTEPVWHLFAVAHPSRDTLRHALADRGIGTLVHYFPLPHLTPAYRADGWREGSLPIAEGLSERSLSLPLYPQLGDDDQDAVIAAVTEWLER